MAAKYKLNDYALLKGKNIFFDANILIYLFWPTGKYNYEQNYALVFSKLLKQENNIFVDLLVISEIINRAIKIEYEKHLLNHSLTNKQFRFKEYYHSNDGKEALSDIYLIVKNNILKRFNVVEKSFNKEDIENLLVVDELGFVDKAIVSICTENKFVLLTNDKDFKNSGLDILTSNPQILN